MDKRKSMIIERYVGKKLTDSVFAVNAKAKEAIKKYGKENVINATIGSLYTEEGTLAVYDVVDEVYRKLPNEELYSYSTNVIGEDDYLEEVKKSILNDNYKDCLEQTLHITSVATAGGTGALSNTIKNYLNPGEQVLVPNWMWGTYENIVFEHGGSTLRYKLFDDDGNFALHEFVDTVNELAKKQKNLIIIINEPSHNPTGYRMTYEEWEVVDDTLKSVTDKCNVILIRDAAYFEYDDRGDEENRKIRKLLLDLPENMLVVYAFSLSKSFSIYGMRVGAQVAISSDKNAIEDFKNAMLFSSRVTWSNVSKGGMKVFAKIMKDENLKARFEKEKDEYTKLLYERSHIFLKEAEEIGLGVLPYKSGFFVTVPIGDNVVEVMDDLAKQNIYVLKFNNGLRIGICSVTKAKIKGLATKIKESRDKFLK